MWVPQVRQPSRWRARSSPRFFTNRRYAVSRPPGQLAGVPCLRSPQRPHAANPDEATPPAEPPAAHRRSHPWYSPRENRTCERLRRPPAPRAEHKTRRTAAGLSPTPGGDADPGSGAPFPRYNPTRPPGRGSVWQSTWFGIRGSQVQILPPRRGPSPRTGSGPEAAPASGCFGRIFPRPFPPRNRAVISALTHGSKRVYSGALAEDVCPGECPFSCSCFLTSPNRV